MSSLLGLIPLHLHVLCFLHSLPLFGFVSIFLLFYDTAGSYFVFLFLGLPHTFGKGDAHFPSASPAHTTITTTTTTPTTTTTTTTKKNNKELTLTLLCSLPPTPSRQQPQKTKGKQTMKMVFLICKMFASYMLTVPFILWLQFLPNFGLFWTESIGVMVNFPRYSFPAAHGGTSKEECIICFETLESRPTGYTACGARSIILILRDDPLLCY